MTRETLRERLLDKMEAELVEIFEREREDDRQPDPDPDRSESPLEFEMFHALLSVGFARRGEARAALGHIYQQVTVDTHLQPYRVDLAVARKVGRFVLKLAIEVDGHDFHRVTKAQIEDDCRRDRALIREGWRPLRYPGSEVNRDARTCALDVAGIVIEWVNVIEGLLA